MRRANKANLGMVLRVLPTHQPLLSFGLLCCSGCHQVGRREASDDAPVNTTSNALVSRSGDWCQWAQP